MVAEGTSGGKAQELLDHLKNQIVACDMEGSIAAARQVVDARIDPIWAMKYAIGEAARIVGEKFDAGDYYLPHLVMAGDAMAAVGEVFEKVLPQDRTTAKKVVVIGTVEGDMHSVGKNIVAMMLKAGGFTVYDLGVDVKSSAFIAKAKEVRADIIALSSLLTTTLPYQREVIEDLKAQGIRDRFKILIGGGPVTPEWAERIGADGLGKDAVEGLKVAKALVGME
jgi:methanogenic corrinoid protein MtbC1